MNFTVTALLLFVGISFFAYTMYGRVLALSGMKPADRLDRPLERLRRMTLFALGQKRMLDPEERGPGLMHLFIYGAFMVLALRTASLFAMGFSETLLSVLRTGHAPFWTEHPTLATLWRGYLFAKDIAATLA